MATAVIAAAEDAEAPALTAAEAAVGLLLAVAAAALPPLSVDIDVDFEVPSAAASASDAVIARLVTVAGIVTVGVLVVPLGRLTLIFKLPISKPFMCSNAMIALAKTFKTKRKVRKGVRFGKGRNYIESE